MQYHAIQASTLKEEVSVLSFALSIAIAEQPQELKICISYYNYVRMPECPIKIHKEICEIFMNSKSEMLQLYLAMPYSFAYNKILAQSIT